MLRSGFFYTAIPGRAGLGFETVSTFRKEEDHSAQLTSPSEVMVCFVYPALTFKVLAYLFGT